MLFTLEISEPGDWGQLRLLPSELSLSSKYQGQGEAAAGGEASVKM